MPVKRVLADCVVLSLQDSSVFYPSCRGCFARIDVQQQDETRCRCSKCGYSCSRELLDYRYRLSVWATRNGCIFGITVFGSCLTPFFGVHAQGFKRLLEISDGPIKTSTRSTLLMKAVEDCFVGRRFLFGIKLSDTERLPWVQITAGSSSCSTEKVQVIASQMIQPKAPLLGGCTVVSYYQILLQKAAECDSSHLCNPIQAAPLLKRLHPEVWGFEHDASGFCPLSLQRMPMHQDSTLSPTPPFQQSMGLVTSSAEQEFCSNKDSEDRNNSQTGGFYTPKVSRRRSPGDSGSIRTPLSFSSPLALNFSHTTFGGEFENPSFNWNFPPAGNNTKATGFSTSELNEPPLTGSVVWEDLPFSESLSKFLDEENMVDNDGENEQKGSKSISRERNVTTKPTLSPWMSDRRSQSLMNITNMGHLTGDHYELRNSIGSTTSRPNKTLDVNPILLDAEAEETFGRNSFNFSADLFNNSPVNSVTTETVRASFPQLEAEAQKSPKGETVRETFVPLDIQDLDFVPPSQSTPIVRADVAPHGSYRPNRFGRRFNPKCRNPLLSPNHFEIPHKHDCGCSDLTACDYGDSRDAIFPPTPVAEAKRFGKDPMRRHVRVNLGQSWEEQGSPKKRVRLTRAPSGCHSRTGSSEGGTIVKGELQEWNDDSCVGNYSRDLFSDSV